MLRTSPNLGVTKNNLSLSHTLSLSLSLSVSLSVLTTIFQSEPGLAVLLELRITEVVVTTGAIRRVKLQLNRHQQINTQVFSFYRSNALPVAQPRVSKH